MTHTSPSTSIARCTLLLLLGVLASCDSQGSEVLVAVLGGDTTDAALDAGDAPDGDAAVDGGDISEPGDALDATGTIGADTRTTYDDISVDTAAPQCTAADDLRLLELDVAVASDVFGNTDIHVLRSAEAFRDYLGQAPPADVDFATEWVAVVGGRGWYGERVEIEALSFCSYGTDIHTTRWTRGEGCELFDVLSAGGILVRFARPELAFAFDESGSASYTRQEVACDASSPGSGQPCTHATLCQPGLACAGLTRAATGTCVSPESATTFTSVVTVPIADGVASPTVSSNVVVDASSELLDVAVRVSLSHPSPRDVQIALRSPTGEREVLWDHEGSVKIWEPGTYGDIERAADTITTDEVNGTWQLEIIDDVPGNIGQLEGWAITVVTR